MFCILNDHPYHEPQFRMVLEHFYLGLIMWKCNRMGLLPTHESDWLAFKEPLIRKDFIQGGAVM